jgi:branched-subunit amino acid transport protein
VNRVWSTIVFAGIGTYTMRASFLVFAHRLTQLPPWMLRILRQIPPAALASLVVPALLRPEGTIDFFQPRFVAGVIAAVVAWRTRNTALTLVVGMAALLALRAL